MVEDEGRRARSCHKEPPERKTLGYTLGPHCVLTLFHPPSPSFECHVCPFLQSVGDQKKLQRKTSKE